MDLSNPINDGDFWNDLPIELKDAIEVAKAQLNKGEGLPHEQVMAKIKAVFLNDDNLSSEIK